jgi:hypothetical protein
MPQQPTPSPAFVFNHTPVFRQTLSASEQWQVDQLRRQIEEDERNGVKTAPWRFIPSSLRAAMQRANIQLETGLPAP